MSLIELFNNVDAYDVIVENDEKQYHLMSKLLKKHSPFFSRELDKIEIKQDPMMISSNSQSKLFLSGKKIIKLDQYQLNNEAAIKVLRNMYGEQLTITKDNSTDFLKISTLFEMSELMSECCTILEVNINLNTLLNDLTEAEISKSLLMPVYRHVFMRNILMFERDALMGFVTGLPIDSLFQILSSNKLACTENYVFDIVDHVIKTMISPSCMDDCLKLMSCVRLPLLSEKKLLEEAKVHPLVDKDKYIEALEFQIRPNNKFAYRPFIAFALGKMNEKYDEYRMITNNEIENVTFLELFKNMYLEKGIYCLDNFKNGIDYCLSTNTKQIKMDGFYIRPYAENVEKGKYTRLYTRKSSKIIDDDIKPFTLTEEPGGEKIGFFVSVGTKF